MKLCSNVVSWRVTVAAAGFAMALKINDGFMQMCQQQSGCDTFIFHLLSLLFLRSSTLYLSLERSGKKRNLDS